MKYAQAVSIRFEAKRAKLKKAIAHISKSAQQNQNRKNYDLTDFCPIMEAFCALEMLYGSLSSNASVFS